MLKGHDVVVIPKKGECGEDKTLYALASGDWIETVALASQVSRKMVRYLARKADIPIHHFYNPILVPGWAEGGVH